jgi:phosphatidylserine/phosphatidylglycerophosphate/cardiolipin synthase-like enzyme
MRVVKSTNELKVVAISGTYVVTLGYNLPKNKCKGLLGFSIRRIDHTEGETRFLEGMKCFEETDPGFPAGAQYSTKDHPIQGFQWADYAAKPGHTYTYTVTALKGTPENLQPFDATSVKITTENTDFKSHDVYFNRGTAASQEYIRRFGDDAPEDVPNNAAWKWLSRGLYEAMVAFVESCNPNRHSLRIAAYEFTYEPFLEVLKSARDRGVDIQIIYDARKDKPGDTNEEAIKNVGIANICTARREGKSYISHNKFMVKLDKGKPKCVWTGGTNFSDGGIFGHSNVAHIIEDDNVAADYMTYWELLKQDETTPVVRDEVETFSVIPGLPVNKGSVALFSPRNNLDALSFYADLAMEAKEGLFMTFAFGINKLFKDVYKNSNAAFRLALLEKKTRAFRKDQEAEKKAEERAVQALRNMPENVFAIGEFIRTNRFDGWVKEKLTNLNKNVRYVHNKFMLIDPLSEDPVVVTGSANFSDASTKNNDENMLIIRGNKRIADIYFGEFMRLFSHHSFRESLNWRRADEPPKPLATEDTWWADSFGSTPRSSRRKYFAQVNT